MNIQPITLQDALQEDEPFLAFLAQEARSEQFAARRREAESGVHPTDEMLYNYVLEELDEGETTFVRRHIAFCRMCNEDVLRIRRIEAHIKEDFAELAAAPPAQPQPETDWLADIKAALTTIPADLVQWASELWQPQWAGQPVVASDVPQRTHTVNVPDGAIEISCLWRGKYESTPGYIQVGWAADFESDDGELWAVFFDPDTKKLLTEIRLGDYFEDVTTLTSDSLGFDPTHRPWAISILLKTSEENTTAD